MTREAQIRRISTTDFRKKKSAQEKIVFVTAYDFPTALLVDESGVDAILVGDSLGMVVLGYETTIPVTIEDMIHHTRAVSRGVKRAFVAADMPFLTYQSGTSDALKNAGRLMQEAGAMAVKLEGGIEICPQVQALVTAGIPVIGHLGLTPQSIHVFGGYKMQGRDDASARKIVADAMALESAGAFLVVLECIPAELAAEITSQLTIPTIGIGAGPHCDGQILVLYDLLGITGNVQPSFVKQYAQIGQEIRAAVKEYASEVREGKFPAVSRSASSDDSVLSYSSPKKA